MSMTTVPFPPTQEDHIIVGSAFNPFAFKYFI